MSEATTAALVGATGGAGTTRTTVELAATLARDGRSVAVVDAAFATQGLAQYVSGRIDPDVTALVTDRSDATLSTGLVELELDLPGRVACLPAYAPFERLARAKTPDAARRFESRIAEAAERYDRVLVDVPPVASNQAIAAVNAVSRVAVVAPGTTRGADSVQRLRARLRDIGVEVEATIAVRGNLPGADVSIPELDRPAVEEAPACLDAGPTAVAVARAAEVVLDCELDLDFEERGWLDRRLSELRE